MAKDPEHEVAAVVSQTSSQPRIDTIRVVSHDLRQRLVGILLLARTEGGDVRRRFDTIIVEAEWLLDLVEAALGDAAEDTPRDLEVVDLVAHCVHSVEVSRTDRAVTIGVADDGPGLGQVPKQNSLGLTITRALECTCVGAFDLNPGAADGKVSGIVLSATRSMAVS